MKVIGTAGHIDHGKSTLVRRLTGIDPDRLEEEKRRGMTIDLGFAWLDLPESGRISVVDVPGHERFIKNMLAGAAGIDAALLVVAADESVMPQTREHLDILDLLGIRHGVVALTKADLVDDEWLQLVADDIGETLTGTGLAGSRIVPVSAVTGAGVRDLIAALDAVLEEAPARADRGFPYLPVDRVFTVAGFGTVVTGTLHGGILDGNGDVQVLPAGERARIRGLQTHGQETARATPGDRVAVNLSGISREKIRRGDVVAPPGAMQTTRRFDAWLRVLEDAPFPLRHGLEVSVHVGAAERHGVLGIMEGRELPPGGAGWVSLGLDEPVATVKGARFIVRLPAPVRTVAGGDIVDIAPRHRRSDAAATARLEMLRNGDGDAAALAALTGARPRNVEHIARQLGEERRRTEERLRRLLAADEVVDVAGSFLTREAWLALEGGVREALEDFHAGDPTSPGMGREELRARMRLGKAEFAAAIRRLAEGGAIEEHGPQVALPGRAGSSAARQEEADRLVDLLRRDGLAAPTGADLRLRSGAGEDVMAALVREGQIVRIGDGMYLDRATYEVAVQKVVMLARERELTVAEVRDMLGTTRKYALALLEYLDSIHVTRRVGDARVLGRQAPACA